MIITNLMQMTVILQFQGEDIIKGAFCFENQGRPQITRSADRSLCSTNR